MAYIEQTLALDMPVENVVTKDYWENLLSKLELANNTAQSEIKRLSDAFDLELANVVSLILAEAQANLDAASSADVMHGEVTLATHLTTVNSRLDTAETDIDNLEAAVGALNATPHNDTLIAGSSLTENDITTKFYKATSNSLAHHTAQNIYISDGIVPIGVLPYYSTLKNLDSVLRYMPTIIYGVAEASTITVRPNGAGALRIGDIYVKHN